MPAEVAATGRQVAVPVLRGRRVRRAGHPVRLLLHPTGHRVLPVQPLIDLQPHRVLHRARTRLLLRRPLHLLTLP